MKQKMEATKALARPLRNLLVIFSCLLAAGLILSAGRQATRLNHSRTTDALPALRGEAAIERLKADGQYDSLGAAMTAARYQIEQRNANEYQATNHAHKFAATFDTEGVRLLVNGEAETSESVWKLISLGYGAAQTEVTRGRVTSAGQRVEIERAEQGLTEWYENRPGGLEQGFLLRERPMAARETEAESLRLILSVGGEMRARASADGQAIELAGPDGRDVLRYEGLKVWDAQGRAMEAQMTAQSGEVWLEVADREAAYPLTIDPTFGAATKLTASDGLPGDDFGESVSLDLNTAIIGAYLDDIGSNSNQGSAYIFKRTGANWTQQQKLVASDGAPNDFFGVSVSVHGNSVVVGATGDDIGANSLQGSAYIFEFDGTIWTERAKLIANDGGVEDFFGSAVDLFGNIAIVGAGYHDTGGNVHQGAAYIFVRNEMTWSQQDKIVANDGASGDLFGYEVAISGATAIIGAPFDDTGITQNHGSAYIFRQSGSNWVQQQKLIANDGEALELFGASVGIFNNFAIIGAPRDDIGSTPDQGSAYIFKENPPGTWTLQQKLIASDGAAFDNFGHSVDIVGDLAIVGAPFDETGTLLGSAYIFEGNSLASPVWGQRRKLTAPDGGPDSAFGLSVSLSNQSLILVGSPDDDAAYAYQRSAPFDFDGDLLSDFSVFRPSNGTWFIANSGSNNSLRAVHWGLPTDKITPFDFDGDSRADAAVWRVEADSRAFFIILQSQTNSIRVVQFGTQGDQPGITGDWDGDGRADPAVFRSDGQGGPSHFFYRGSTEHSNGGFTTIQWGRDGDRPLAGDFDGDGRADAAVFRPSDATWYILRSSTPTQPLFVHWGVTTDTPVPADYDADGKTDIAVFRPSTATWFIRQSTNNQQRTQQWGVSTDIPVPAGYFFLGADIAVWRPDEGRFYVTHFLTGEPRVFSWGTMGDVPIPSVAP